MFRDPIFVVAVKFSLLVALIIAVAVNGDDEDRLFRSVAYHNIRPKTDDSKYDIHDGPIIEVRQDGRDDDALFYRYAMSYTECYLRCGKSGSWNARKHRLFAGFVESVHGTGFDCSQIVLGSLVGGAPAGSWGEDCGFKTPELGQTVSIWRSTDLVNWEFVRDALRGDDADSNITGTSTTSTTPDWLRKDSIIFRPAILYNEQSQKYVLWLNRLPRNTNNNNNDKKSDPLVVESYRHAGYVVGTADSPDGPFAFVEEEDNSMVEMEHKGGADFALLRDNDDSHRAYILYGAWHHYGIPQDDWRHRYYPEWAKKGHQISIQQLDPETFTRPVGPSTRVTDGSSTGQESPSMFQRSGVYYILYGDLCCFCERGADAKVYASRNPLGPYEYVTNLNAYGPDHIPAQSSGIVSITEYDGTVKYIWTADMWFSSRNGYKGDDFQYFQPLEFRRPNNKNTNGDGIDIPYRDPLWQDCFELRFNADHSNNGSTNNTRCETYMQSPSINNIENNIENEGKGLEL